MAESCGDNAWKGRQDAGKGKAKGPPGPLKGKGKGPGKAETKVQLTLEEQVFLNRFGFHRRTATLSGCYKLSAHTAPSSQAAVTEGSYSFDEDTGTISNDSAAKVGTFSAATVLQPIRVTAFGSSANALIPCIDVVNSEIMNEIQNPDNAGAFFVLPSQFNGAEYPSDRGIVTEIDAYKFDNTGGPRGQLAVHPAAGQFVLDNAACGDKLGLNSIDKVLSKTNADLIAAGLTASREQFSLINGYLRLPQPRTRDAATKIIEALQGQVHLVRPLLMSAVPACGLVPNKSLFASGGHTVNLFYASAVPINSYVNGIGTVSKDFGDADLETFQLACAETIAMVQYLGALTVAATLPSEERRRVFLMPLGGGAFRNPWDSIVRAMSLAVELLGDDLRSRLEIRALAFQDGTAGKSDLTPECVKLTELLRVHGKLRGPGFDM